MSKLHQPRKYIIEYIFEHRNIFTEFVAVIKPEQNK